MKISEIKNHFKRYNYGLNFHIYLQDSGLSFIQFKKLLYKNDLKVAYSKKYGELRIYPNIPRKVRR